MRGLCRTPVLPRPTLPTSAREKGSAASEKQKPRRSLLHHVYHRGPGTEERTQRTGRSRKEGAEKQPATAKLILGYSQGMTGPFQSTSAIQRSSFPCLQEAPAVEATGVIFRSPCVQLTSHFQKTLSGSIS